MRITPLIVVMALAAGTSARAQSPTGWQATPTIGIGVGPAANLDVYSRDVSPRVDATVEFPASPTIRLRLEATQAGWSIRRPAIPVGIDRFTTRSLTIGVDVLGHEGAARPYFGAGAGVYRYGFFDEAAFRASSYLEGGIELRASRRWTFDAEAGVQDIRAGFERRQLNGRDLVIFDVTLRAKVTFGK